MPLIKKSGNKTDLNKLGLYLQCALRHFEFFKIKGGSSRGFLIVLMCPK